MSKKVLIISTSIRYKSNSEVLAKEAEKGAKDAGHEVEFISLKDKVIQFCRGCLTCQKIGHCVINDHALEITEKIKNSDVIVWVTPIYYYEMSGQMKTLIDRANSLYADDYKFREVYLITTSGDESEDAIHSVVKGVQSWISCFNNVEFKGFLSAAGPNMPGDIFKHPEYIQKAYDLGKNI